MVLKVGRTRQEGTGALQSFATARIGLQKQRKLSVHVGMDRKRETYLLELRGVTRSSPEATYISTPNTGIDAHGDEVHEKMAGGTQRHVSIRQIDRELPDSPIGSRTRHADLPDGLESHENTPKMRRHVHSDVEGSNTPENVPVSPD